MVDQFWQHLRQHATGFTHVQTHFLGQPRQRIFTQHIAQLVASHGLVGTGTDPGANRVAHAGLLELTHQTAQAAVTAVIAEHAGDG